MAFYTPAGTKVLNLPEQVQKNLEDIADLKTAQTALETSKQDASTAVTKESLVTDISGKDVDLGATSVTSLTNTGNTTNNGTLDQEGTATFGSDVEVDGNVTLNSPESILFKTGSLDFSELTSFIATYNREAYQFRFANALLDAYEESGSEFNPVETMPNIVNATNLTGCFQGAKPGKTVPSAIILPDMVASSVLLRETFAEITGIDTIVLNNISANFQKVCQYNTALKYFKVADGKTAKTAQYSGMQFAFVGCTSLLEIGAIDCSNITYANAYAGWINDCTSLKSIHCTHFKVSFGISASTQFEEADLVEIIGNLDTVSTAQTLTMGSTNLAKLTEDEILVATGKGWTLA